MPLELRDVVEADWATMLTHRHNHGGDLTSPSGAALWAESADDDDMAARLAYSIAQQRAIAYNDPTVRYLKVVDTDADDEIMALGRWHRYEHGFSVDSIPAEMGGEESEWPAQLNRRLAHGMLMPQLAERPEWQGTGPMWLLATLTTRSGYRLRGAGRMIARWGLEQAIKDGVPAFIEASPEGAHVYFSAGFQKVGQWVFDMDSYGAAGGVITVLKMAGNLPR